MADSIRKQVIDSIVSVLNSSTGITTATSNLKSWFDYNPHEFPVATVLDRDTEITRLQFKSTAQDKEAVMNLVIRGYIFDGNNVTAAKRTNLIRDIQQKIETGSTTMSNLIFDIKDTAIETDDGILDAYSIFDIMYDVTYFYNHGTP